MCDIARLHDVYMYLTMNYLLLCRHSFKISREASLLACRQINRQLPYTPKYRPFCGFSKHFTSNSHSPHPLESLTSLYNFQFRAIVKYSMSHHALAIPPYCYRFEYFISIHVLSPRSDNKIFYFVPPSPPLASTMLDL